MVEHAFLLLELSARNEPTEFTTIWFNCTKSNLILAPQGQHTAVLAVLNEKDNGVDKLAEWIEEPDGAFDNIPLFIIWDNRPCDSHSMAVHEYAPFDNGIRQLVKEYRP